MADNTDNNENTANGETPPTRPTTIKDFLFGNKYDACLWFIRLYIIFCTVCFIIPVLGMEFGQSCFKRVLLGCAAISALRLQQRMPRIQLSMEFAKQLALEDSFHYLAYSILFLTSNAATMVLMPIVIFAVMHAATYTRKLIEISGNNNGILMKLKVLIGKIEKPEMQQQMLTFIATNEIMIFPVSILMVLSGNSTILVPFFYYRFLQLRYSSRRNPYSRTVFSQFRMGIDRLSYHAKCPAIGQKILQGFVALVLRFSPAA